MEGLKIHGLVNDLQAFEIHLLFLPLLRRKSLAVKFA